jgi:hypothetical protein
MKYAAEMGSVGVLCIPSFIKTGSAIQTHRQHGDRAIHIVHVGGSIVYGLLLFLQFSTVNPR